MQHPAVVQRAAPSSAESARPRGGAHRPPPLNFSRQTCGSFVPTASISSPSPQAIHLASECRAVVETKINTTFSQYTVKSAATSYPTPGSGSTSGTDYFIQVEVNTKIRSQEFTGDAKYMQLTVFVDTTCGHCLKEYQFQSS